MRPVLTQKVSSVQKGHEHVLGIRPSRRQPLFALELLPTENHTWTGAVPVDGGHLGVVPLRVQFRAPRVARDGVKRPAGLVDDDRIDDVRTAVRKFEFDLGSLGTLKARPMLYSRVLDLCWSHSMCVGTGRVGRSGNA